MGALPSLHITASLKRVMVGHCYAPEIKSYSTNALSFTENIYEDGHLHCLLPMLASRGGPRP